MLLQHMKFSVEAVTGVDKRPARRMVVFEDVPNELDNGSHWDLRDIIEVSDSNEDQERILAKALLKAAGFQVKRLELRKWGE